MQQINPWEPWAEWPAQPPAQQAQLDLNLQQQGQQQNQEQLLPLNAVPQHLDPMALDLNLDPLEVIINPVNPPAQEFLEVNDFIDEIEQHIPHHLQQVVNENNQIVAPQEQAPQLFEGINDFINGAPLPHLPDLIGEEIPLEQLMEQEGIEQQNNMGHLHNNLEDHNEPQDMQLLGPEEQGFSIMNFEAIHPPLNPAANNLVNLVDDLQMQEAQPPAQPQQGIQIQQDQVLPENGNNVINQHLQVGMVLLPKTQWEAWQNIVENRKRYHESSLAWGKFYGQGNAGKNLVTIPEN
jgi:hypothetical protein